MTSKMIALIVGATGLSGSYTGRHLKEAGWTFVTLSRGAANLPFSDRHIAADLEDASASTAGLKAASDVTHVSYCTWSRRENEAENVRVNAAMIRNLFDGLADAPIRHAAKQLHWAATTPGAANMPFNIVNGDLFRWTWL